MAADEHNIILTPVLKIDEVLKSAEKLRKAIETAFNSNNVDLNRLESGLRSLNNKMLDVVSTSVAVERRLKRLETFSIPTEDYEKLIEQLSSLNDQMAIYLNAWKDALSVKGEVTGSTIKMGEEQDLTEIQMVVKELSEDMQKLTQMFMMGQNVDFTVADKTFESIQNRIDDILTDYYLLIKKQQELNAELGIFLDYWYQASDFMQTGLGSMKKATKPNKGQPIDVTFTPVGEEVVEDMQKVPEIIHQGSQEIVGMTGNTQDLVRLLRLAFGQFVGFGQISRISTGVKSLSGLLKNGLKSAILVVKDALKGLFAMVMAHPIILVITAIIALVVYLGSKIKKVIDETKEQVDALFASLGKLGKKVLSTLGDLTKTLAKGFLDTYLKTFKFFSKLITTLVQKLRSLKSTVEEGIKKMATLNKGSNEINKALSNLTSSLTYVKNALAAAFVPILTMVEPILTRLLNLLGDIINTIGMLIAKITGATSYRKAIRQQQDFAKSLNGVGDAASGAAEKLASYDKLEVISKNSGVDNMFSTVDIKDFEIPDWMDKLYEFGNKIGTKIRDALNGIPWEEVKKGAETAAKAVSNFLNGIIDTEGLGKSIGKALGEGLNTIVRFVNGLFGPEGIHWHELAVQFGEGLTEFINSIEFDQLGQVFSNIINTTAQFISDFIANWNIDNLKDQIHEFFENSLGKIDWPTVKKAAQDVMTRFAEILNAAITPENFEILGTTLAETLNTVFLGVESFVKGAEFKQWGDSLGTGIMKFFKDFDFPKAGQTISNLATGILDMISSAIDKMEEEGGWDEIGDKLVEFISNIKWEEIGSKALDIAKRLREGFSIIWEKLKETDAFSDMIQLFVDFLNEKSNWEDMIDDVKWDVVKETLWTKLKTFLADFFHIEEAKEVFGNAGEFFSKIPEAIESGDLATVGESIFWGIIEGIRGMLTVSLGGEGAGSVIAGVLVWMIDTLKSVFGIKSDNGPAENLEPIGEDAVEGVAEGFKGFDIWGFIKKWWDENVAPWFTWDKWVEICENVKGALLEQFGLTETDLSEIWDNIKKKPLEIFEELKEAIKAPLNGVLTTIENFINDAIDAVNKFTSQVNKIAFDMPTFGGGNVHFGVSIPQLDKVQLPRLAQGAVIPPNREFAAILGDQKSGMNIETPLETMIQAFRQAISEIGGSNRPVILQLNGRTVAQAVWDEEEKRYKQTGRYQTV